MSFDVTGVITTAGRAALIDADNAGLTLRLKWVAFGAGTLEPDESWTALSDERTRAEIVSAARIDPSTLEVAAIFDGETELRVWELGIFADDGSAAGLLFAVCWRSGGMFEKSEGVPYPFHFQLPILALPVDAISFEADVILNLDLAFIGPLAANLQSISGLTRRQTIQELRIRRLAGLPTGGMEDAI